MNNRLKYLDFMRTYDDGGKLMINAYVPWSKYCGRVIAMYYPPRPEGVYLPPQVLFHHEYRGQTLIDPYDAPAMRQLFAELIALADTKEEILKRWESLRMAVDL